MAFIVLKDETKKFPFNRKIFFNKKNADKYIKEHCNNEVYVEVTKQETKKMKFLGGFLTMDVTYEYSDILA